MTNKSVRTDTPQLFAPNLESMSAIECQSFKNPSIPKVASNSRIPMAQNNFKSQLCKKFKYGSCTYGYKCRFAHGSADVRRPLLRSQGVLNEKDRLELPKTFRHRNGNVREEWAIAIDTSTGSTESHITGSSRLEGKRWVNRNLDANRLNPKPVIFKTKLCYNWDRTRNCAYGRDCCFAHGRAEMQKFSGHTSLGCGISQPTIPKTCDSAKNALSCRTGLELQDLKFTWSELGRMSRIYADWI
ncbi:zinc finger CCCH domain-containing protein 39 [Ziziphus jujuba]|uniref:Zinc finger CCCH domain-containing protein 39 n=1 Tax=Ziziphus jujuba TaxID=326968 RepID=A0A6P3Z7X4_ZIZJJ|nr:zinc finger CCCH domain-containing protein 39 [Ziziphus jujuba]